MNNFCTRCGIGDAWLFKKRQDIFGGSRRAAGSNQTIHEKDLTINVRAAYQPSSDVRKEVHRY